MQSSEARRGAASDASRAERDTPRLGGAELKASELGSDGAEGRWTPPTPQRESACQVALQACDEPMSEGHSEGPLHEFD